MYFELSNLKSENNFSMSIRGRGITSTFLLKKHMLLFTYAHTHNTQHTTHAHFSQDLPESVSNFS